MTETAKRVVLSAVKPFAASVAGLALAAGVVVGGVTIAMAAKYRAAAERIVTTSPNAAACQSALHALMGEKSSWMPGTKEDELAARCKDSFSRSVVMTAHPSP